MFGRFSPKIESFSRRSSGSPANPRILNVRVSYVSVDSPACFSFSLLECSVANPNSQPKRNRLYCALFDRESARGARDDGPHTDCPPTEHAPSHPVQLRPVFPKSMKAPLNAEEWRAAILEVGLLNVRKDGWGQWKLYRYVLRVHMFCQWKLYRHVSRANPLLEGEGSRSSTGMCARALYL